MKRLDIAAIQMQNVFYGNDGIDIAFQREKISWKEHQMLLAIIEKMA